MSATLVYGGLTLTGGSPYEILLAGADLGNPKPVTTAVRSLFLDGSVVTGRFSDNRTVAFVVQITASTAAATTSAMDALAYQVDQSTNVITWTPVTALPQAFDTFRGEMHEQFDWEGRTATQRRFTVTMPALPFGRTPSTSTLTASTVASVLLEGFEGTAPAYTYQGGSGTLTKVSGASNPYLSGADTGTYYGQGTSGNGTSSTQWWSITESLASVSIAGRSVVRFAYFDVAAYGGYVLTQSYTLTLTSSGGSSTWIVSPAIFAAGVAGWHTVTFDLTATPSSTTGSGYSAAALTGYTLRADKTQSITGAFNFYIDSITAYASGSGTVTSADAGAYAMSPVIGSARCPMDLRVDRGGTNTLTDLLVYQAPIEAPTGYAPLLTGTSPYTTATGVNLAGTFTVIASIKAASQGSANGVAVSIQQKQGASNVGTAWTSGTVTSTTGDAYVVLGEVTLPLVGTSATNTGVSYAVTVTTGSAVVLDMFLLDTRGALVFVGPTPVTAAKYLFIAAPQAATGVGGVFSGSASDLSDATSVSASARMSGGQMNFTPGSNTLVVCSTDASSDLVVTATYSPRWLTERTS